MGKSSSTSFKIDRYGKSGAGSSTGRPQLPIPKEALTLHAQISKKERIARKKKRLAAEAAEIEMQLAMDEEAKSKKTGKKKKKKRAVEEDDQPAVTRELTLVDKKRSVRTVEKYEKLGEQVKKTAAVFGLRKADIMEAVEAGDIDFAVLQMQRQAYSTIVNMIPLAEQAYLKDKREHQIYALNALISQARELAADLMASSDRSQLAEKLIHEMLEPTFKSILQTMMQEQLKLKHLIDDKIKPEYRAVVARDCDQVIKEVAGTMNVLFQVTSQQTRKYMLGE
jgi:hypothetical protein